MTITERDEKGRIVKKELSSEQAREMGAKKNTVIKSTSAAQLLKDRGLDIETAEEHLVILAKIAASSKASAVPALTAFLKLTSPADSVQVESGNCPYLDNCLIYQARGRSFTDEELAEVDGRIAEHDRLRDMNKYDAKKELETVIEELRTKKDYVQAVTAMRDILDAEPTTDRDWFN